MHAAPPEKTPPHTIVIFGATGDLASKKVLPALYKLSLEGRISEETSFIGISRKAYTDEEFRNYVRSQLKDVDPLFWKQFEKRLSYRSMDAHQGSAYSALENLPNPLYYLATPPNHYASILDNLHAHKLLGKKAKILIEKPFGTDLSSAKKLQEKISQYVEENQVFRIDHYLGKEGVRNLLSFRSQGKFEPVWNKNYIDHVEITLSETIGVESRGSFWEETGLLRDVFQNHMLQLLAIVSMETPSSKVNLLKEIRPIPKEEIDKYVIRGQYEGYRNEKGVSPHSNVETFVKATFFIDNERWKGVPFQLTSGKRLSEQKTEIAVYFKSGEILLFRIQPHPEILLKTKNKIQSFLKGSPHAPDAYERLFYNALQGNHGLFVEAEEELLAWELLTPVLDHWKTHPPKDFPNYVAGSSNLSGL